MKKPAFIDPVQRVHARVMRVARLDPQAAAAEDGTYPVDCFPPGDAPMAEDDWRQFRTTPENAKRMVDTCNAALAAGKRIRMNYMHDRNGPIAGNVKAAEPTPGGGVRYRVAWTDRAQAAIRAGEWEGTSPEFSARVVQDQDGRPVEENGRVLMEPFELHGGALDNDPAMPELAIAANREEEAEQKPAEEDQMDHKKWAALLGMPETATAEDVEKELASRLAKPAPAAEVPSTEAIAAAVLAQLDPKKLASDVTEAAKAQALEAFKAQEHERAVVATVDGAIRAGRVRKSERDAALKLASADLDSFKTMTASMRPVAPVAAVYQAGADALEPGTDDLDAAAKELQAKRAAEGKPIGILQAAREIEAARRAK